MIPTKASVLGGLMLLASAAVALAEPAKVMGNTLYLRAGPGSAYVVTASMPRGAVVDVSHCDGQWCRVRYRGAVGFADKTHLDTGNGSYATAAPKPAPAPSIAPVPDDGARISRWDDPKWRDNHLYRSRLGAPP